MSTDQLLAAFGRMLDESSTADSSIVIREAFEDLHTRQVSVSEERRRQFESMEQQL